MGIREGETAWWEVSLWPPDGIYEIQKECAIAKIKEKKKGKKADVLREGGWPIWLSS